MLASLSSLLDYIPIISTNQQVSFVFFLLIIKLINSTQEQQHVLYIPILNVKENMSIWKICTVAIMVFAFTFTEIENPPFIRPSKVFKTFYQGKPNSFHVCRCEVRWSFKPQMLVHFSDDILRENIFILLLDFSQARQFWCDMSPRAKQKYVLWVGALGG